MFRSVLICAFVLAGKIALAQGSFVDSPKAKSETFLFEVSGKVFKDLNKNGIQEGYDSGVGGVIVQFPDGKSVVSDADGKFKHDVHATELDNKVSVIPTSIPAGAVFTTPSNYYLTKKLGSRRELNFGVEYKTATTSISHLQMSDKVEKQESKGPVFAIKRSDKQFIINDIVWQNFTQQIQSNINSEHIINVDEVSLELDGMQIEQVISRIKKNIHLLKTINVEIVWGDSGDTSQEKQNSIKNEINLKFIENSIDISKVKYTLQPGTQKVIIKLLQETTSSGCSVDYAGKSIPIEDNENIELQIDKNHPQGKINCDDRWGVFYAPEKQGIMAAATKPIVPSEDDITIEHSQFFTESRDQNLFFKIKTKHITLQVHQDNKPLQELIGANKRFVHAGKRGDNTLIFTEPANQQKYSFTYNLYEENDWTTFIDFRVAWESVDTDSHNTKYEINGFSQTAIGGHYRVNSQWGAGLIINIDHLAGETLLTNFNKTSARHLDLNINATYSFALTDADYFSPTVRLATGIVYKSFDPGDDATIPVSKEFVGPELSAKFFKKEVLPQLLDLEVSSALAVSMVSSGSYSVKLAVDSYVWLNPLGKVFGVTPRYSYYNRYDYFHEARLTLGLAADYSVYEGSNFNGHLRNTQYSLRVGLKTSF